MALTAASSGAPASTDDRRALAKDRAQGGHQPAESRKPSGSDALGAPPRTSAYTFYTSDKELGRVLGHVLSLDVSTVLREPTQTGDTRLLLDARVVGLYYSYPGFILLPSRASVFAELGLTWEL